MFRGVEKGDKEDRKPWRVIGWMSDRVKCGLSGSLEEAMMASEGMSSSITFSISQVLARAKRRGVTEGKGSGQQFGEGCRTKQLNDKRKEMW